jgi:ribose transport system substrate-binding protein
MLHKRMWVLALVGAMGITGLAACGGSSSSTSSASSPSAATTSSSSGSSGTTTAAASGSSTCSAGAIDVGVGCVVPKAGNKNIAFFGQATNAYTYTVAQTNAAVAEGKKLGYNVTISYDNLNPATELANFQQAVSSGKYAGIIFQPVNTQLCVPMRSVPIHSHVLVEIVGTPLCDKGTGNGAELWAPGTISYVGGQNNVDGINSVLATAAKLSTGQQKAAFIMGLNGNPSVVAWQTAWKPFAAAHSNWDLIDTAYTDFTTPQAFTATENAITAHPDITAIFSPYIDVTSGIVKAIQAQGKAGKIKVYENGGGSSIAASLVKAGSLTGDLPVYPESLGSTGVQTMVQALQGKQPPRFIPGDGNPTATTTGVITAANVATFKPQW